jgi:membrane protease YdiL (CAAX protease family)
MTNGRLTLVLLAGFAVAVGLRTAIGGTGVTQSVLAGLVFAATLIALALTARTPFRPTQRSIMTGLGGGLFLCVPAVISRSFQTSVPISASGYLAWALVIVIVAGAEEYFLRGALYAAAAGWLGEAPAVAIGAVAFAGLHVPLYGWHVIPLDLAVGLWLGALRVVGRDSSAPALAHILADLAAWWLR